MAVNGRKYSDAQTRAMDSAMLELSPREACARAAAGALKDPDTGELVPAFAYNLGSANVRKRRARRAAEARARAELPALRQLEGAAEQLAGIAHELAAKAARKHRAGKLTPAELAEAARALRETHRAVLPLLAPASSSSAEPEPETPARSSADDELSRWAADAAQN